MGPGTTSEKWVLLVEDEADVRQLVADRFADAGIATRSAANGAEAIMVIEDYGTPVAILTDLLMPGALGTSVIEYARSELHEVPLAVVTGAPELAPAGCLVIKKPASCDALLEFVRPYCA